MPTLKPTLVLKGETLAQGIAAGKAHLFKQMDLAALRRNRFMISDAAAEIQRLDRAVAQSRSQLAEVLAQANTRNNTTVAQIFSAQTAILEDATFMDSVKAMINAQKSNSEYVLSHEVARLGQEFSRMHNEPIRARFLDIQDVYYRLLRNLLQIEHVRSSAIKRLDTRIVLVSETLLPSDLGLLDFDKIIALVIEQGSLVSHVAIIAKSLGIPALINIAGASALITSGDMLLVDGDKATLTIRPSQAALAGLDTMPKPATPHPGPAETRGPNLPAKTRDGCRLHLLANVGSLKEAAHAFDQGAEGLGLVRSEFFYMASPQLPAPDQEYAFYRALIEAAGKKTVTIRLLDLGADKRLASLDFPEEDNPQLGTRGIRFLLRNPALFMQHVRSICKAALLAPLNILVPFVALPSDLTQSLSLIKTTAAELAVPQENLRIGIMVEVPAAALNIRQLIDKVDFVSIGTNDLLQYLFAAGREDTALDTYRNEQTWPVLLALVKQVVAACRKQKKEVVVCGEAAADPVLAGLLAGVGVRTFSVQPQALAPLREAFEKISCRETTRRAMEIITALRPGRGL